MEESCHDIIGVPTKNIQMLSRLPIPNSNCIIIRARDDPRVLGVELHGSDIIGMLDRESEEAFPVFQTPNFDFVIITS